MKQTIRDFEIKNKKVIIRCDFNVPMKDGVITDDSRIKKSLETINYAIEKDAKIILMSHLGRVESEEDKAKNSLEPVALRLSELLEKDIIFVDDTKGEILEKEIANLSPGDILLVENTRFEDVPSKRESKNDPELGKYWASLGDLYINDAFGTAHRAHASNVGIASNIESGIGFLIEKELKAFDKVLENPVRPLTIILGGAKVTDKIALIDNLVNKADYILIGGGMSFTFLKAMGYEIGKSLLDESNLEYALKMVTEYPEKIILPVDAVCAKEISNEAEVNMRSLNDIEKEEMGLDIGLATFELFKNIIEDSKTIVWNGPVGVFETDAFSGGTKEIAHLLTKIDADVIIGGGDTGSAINKFEDEESYYHVSTGGGASLELLEGKELPGIKIIPNK